MKIVFVHIGKEHLGIEILSSLLKREGHEVNLVWDVGLFSKVDSTFHMPHLERIFKKRNIAEEVIKKNPDLVAFSAYTTTYQWACDRAREIKNHLSVPIVFGGTHPTLVPEKVIAQPFIDYVHVGEGEDTILPFVSALEKGIGLENVHNIVYKKNGKIIRNPLCSPSKSLDDLPLPDKELFANGLPMKDDYAIITSKGCLYNCSFCGETHFNKIYKNKYFRRRSVDSVMEELRVMKERYHFKEVMFWDSILFTDREYVKELCCRFKTEIDVPFRCNGHVSLFTYEIGEILKNAGCYCINFGVQTFNQKMRSKITDRYETNKKIEEAFRICDDLELRYDCDLIFGLPTMTEEDYVAALEFMAPFRYLNRFKCFYLSYYPRLPIVDKSKEMGILTEKDIEDIEEGRINDWFHTDFTKDPQHRRWKENFEKIYKVYPLMPISMRSFIVRKKLYHFFHLIPKGLIVVIQLMIGMLHKDYRFHIHINNYLLHFKNKITNMKMNLPGLLLDRYGK